MRWLAFATALSCAACEEVSGLNDLSFVPEACEPDPLEVSCAAVACGSTVDNCGQTVSCPDTCAPPFACAVGGASDSECGCTGGSMLTPEPPPECSAFAGTTGNTYYLCAPLAFEQARAFCRAFGTDLAVVHSREENDLVASSIDQNALLGLFAPEGCAAGSPCEFVWVDGSAPDFVHWDQGEPNNTGGGEHCVELRRDTPEGRWNDIPCTNVIAFACETTCP